MAYSSGNFRTSSPNMQTSLDPGTGWDTGAWPAEEAFAAAYAQLRKLAQACQRSAVLVVAVDAQGRPVGEAIVEAGHALIIGRHTECGLQLPDEALSLRHLALYALPSLPQAAPTLCLWDLNTGRPFLTEDGEPNEAVTSQGMLYAAVGEYALLFIPTRGRAEPSWPALAGQAWSTLPPRLFIDRGAPSTSRPRARGQRFTTDVGRMDPPRALSSRGSPQEAWGTLKLVLDRHAAYSHLSLAQLDRGVLLGRYERCELALLQLGAISRVHLLLVRVGPNMLAIDTASTLGTRRGERKIQATILADSDTLTLARRLQVHWTRLPTGATDGRG
jgi:pSer/pThr/pTyr-binding forkhead associated (FHA) protein